MSRFSAWTGLAGLLLHAGLVSGAEPVTRPFAAPAVTSAAPADSMTGIAQVTFSLLLVLVAVFVVAVVVRRLRTMTGGSAGNIEILAQTALGQRERAVIVRVGEARLLLGVAQGQVTLLHSLPPDARLDIASPGSPDGRPTFASLLKKSLGR